MLGVALSRVCALLLLVVLSVCCGFRLHQSVLTRQITRLNAAGDDLGSAVGSSKGFIISPSSQHGRDELKIMNHLSQIHMGERAKIGIIGTQELSQTHQQMVELLSYALVLSGNHVFTSGSVSGSNGTNLAAIRGALRACNTELLTVVLPQSLVLQPPEMQALLSRVTNLIEMPKNDELDLREAANLCNRQILARVSKALLFAYHHSETLLSSVSAVTDQIEITKFFLD
jgi:hypothetical protein